MSLDVRVYGTPAPQGSKRHVGHGVMVEQSARVKPWREAVKTAALTEIDYAGDFVTLAGPVAVRLTFFFHRPKSHYRTGKHSDLLRDGAPVHPATRPDVDKLVRSTLDALKDAGVYGDDSQVVELVAVKRYHSAAPQGANVRVWGMS